MTESEWWSRVKVQFSRQGDVCRIESTTGGGVPDVNYAIQGHHGWIELKVAKRGKLIFEKFQIPWLRRRLHHMDALWILALVGPELCLYHASEIVSAPSYLAVTKQKTWTVVNTLDIMASVRGPKPWPWQQVFTILTNKPLQQSEKEHTQ